MRRIQTPFTLYNIVYPVLSMPQAPKGITSMNCTSLAVLDIVISIRARNVSSILTII